MFCVYLTLYKGKLLPPFYIGSTYVDNIIMSGYRGSVNSKVYKDIFKQELKDNPHLFRIKIISYHKTAHEARQTEFDMLTHFRAHRSPLFINLNIRGKEFGGVKGSKWSDERKAKLSKAKTGVKRGPQTPEWKAKRLANVKGRRHSEETKAKLSAIKKGVPKPPRTAEHQAKINAAVKGYVKSPEHLAKIKESRLRNKLAKSLSDKSFS